MTNFIQTTAEVLIAIVSLLTFIVLCRYAYDTKRIASSSVEQLEISQMPFIAMVMKTDPSRISDWAIKNEGSGPALEIYYLRYLGEDKPPMMQWMTPLAPGDEYSLPRESGHRDFKVEYESLSGKKYRTTVTVSDGNRKTSFQRFD